MKKAKLPANEKARLKALYDYQVLDTEAEKIFDDLTLLASEICQTPISLISLIDPDRQWFKSKVGLDADETSRDIAFCSHAILEDEIFEVSDTLKDERFFDNPLVTGHPNIRFYAGAQLVTPAGHTIGTLCAIDSKPKQLTEQQSRSLKILSREVIAQLELRHKIQQLKQINRHKTEFLSNISHELRTPLNAIVNFSALMVEQLKTENSVACAQQKQHAQLIDTSAKHLLSVINSVLDLHKLEQGKMTLDTECVQSDTFFNQLISVMDIQAKQKSIDLELDITAALPPFIETDEVKLRQILINLLSNGIKFSDSMGKVTLKVTPKANKLHIAVIDQGCGIAPNEQAKLFGQFEQASNTLPEGSGLGLAISKALIQLMGGEIELSSTLGQGTTVQMTCPLVVADKTKPTYCAPSQLCQFKTDSKILMVEDTPINQQVATAVFARFNLTLEIASTGEQAIEMAKQQAYDLIFMDIHLPGINGDETAQKINTIHPDTPIVALTADVYSQEYQQQDSVFQQYLTKPIETDKLNNVLAKYLSRK